jgi:tetratricopeptide (TPR) repeat protein
MKHESSSLIDLAADLRKRAELSLNDLARQTGYSRWTLSRYEHGESNIPIGYVAVLAQQVIARRRQQGRSSAGDEARLLAEINAAIVPHYGQGRCLASWADLGVVAAGWLKAHSAIDIATPDAAQLASAPDARSAPVHMLRPPHWQLRAATPDFVGRTAEITQLTNALVDAATTGVCICGIRGLGGIGKTELAYRVAEAVAAHYPDGQLLVELRGSSDAPLGIGEALQQIIRTLAPEVKVPEALAELRAYYRTLLRGKRVFILADDARDAAQLRDLIPPAGNALMVTSRWRFALDGLVEAHVVELTGLPQDAASTLLLGICPRIGLRASRLAELCGGLPLALRIAAGRLASDLTLRVEAYLGHLAHERTRLAALTDDDSGYSVAAVINLSYAALDATARAVLAQLSVFPAGFARDAVAAVVALPQADADRTVELAQALSRLYRASLLEYDAATDHFALHELVRAVAAEHLGDAADAKLRHAAAYAFMVRQLADRARQGGQALLEALLLFDSERPHIDAGRQWAVETGSPEADSIAADYLIGLVHFARLRLSMQHDFLPFCEAVLAMAQRHHWRDIELIAHNSIGIAHGELGNLELAQDAYEQTLAAARGFEAPALELPSLHNIAISALTRGQVKQAIGHAEQLLKSAELLNNPRGRIHALTLLGWARRLLDTPQAAIEHYEAALQLAREEGDLYQEVHLLCNLANAVIALVDASVSPADQYARACAYANQAHEIAERLGDSDGQAQALAVLGNAATVLGDPQAALEPYQEALAIYRELGNQHHEGAVLGNIGDAYRAAGELEIAAEHYQQAIALSDATGDRWTAARARWYLAIIMLHQHEVPGAIPLMQAALAFEQAIGHPKAATHAEQLARVQAWLERNGG